MRGLLENVAAGAMGAPPEPPKPGPPDENEFTIWPFALLSIILVLSILFDLGKSAVEHSTPEIFEPIVEAFFSELATLGFIGALAFLMTYNFNSDCEGACSVMQRLSEHFLGNEEELQEIFEQLHFLLFAVSVVFIFVVLILLRLSLRKGREWADWEYQLSHTDQSNAATPKNGAKPGGNGLSPAATGNGFNSVNVHNLMSFADGDSGPFWRNPSWLIGEWVKKEGQAQSEYYRFRHRFIDDDEEVIETQMDSDFDFGMYLKLTLAHTFAEIIEIKPIDWLVLWLAFGVLFLLYFFQPSLILWTVILAECAMFLFSLMVQSKLFHIRHQLMPEVSNEVSFFSSMEQLPAAADDPDDADVATPLLAEANSHTAADRESLISPVNSRQGRLPPPLQNSGMASPQRGSSPARVAPSSLASMPVSSAPASQFASVSTVSTRKGRMSAASGISLAAPKYLRQQSSKPAHMMDRHASSKALLDIKKKDKKGETNHWEKFVAVLCWPCLFLASPVRPNKQQRLFWFGRKGHAFLIHTLKLLMFGSVIILANVAVKMQHELLAKSIFLLVAALLPPIFTLLTVPLSIQTLNFVTAIEYMKHEKLVIEVIKHQRYEKQKKVIHILTSLQFFLDKAEQLSIDTKDSDADPNKKVEPVKSMFARLVKSRSTRHLVDDLRELFNSFDTDGSGNIDREELGLLLQQMGQQKEPEEVDRLFNLMDADGSGDVDFEEFACVILQNKSAKKNLDPKSMAERMWKLFDMDGDGSISPDEMIQAFQKLGKNWDVNEIRTFLHDIDADKSGTIEKQEFVDFVVESMGGHGGHGGHGHGHGHGH